MMDEKKKNRMQIDPEEFPPEHNRIRDIRKEERQRSSLPVNKKNIIMASVIALMGIAAILLIIYINKKPSTTLPAIGETGRETLPFDDSGAGLSGPGSAAGEDNIHIKHGRESYERGYYNDAATEFKEVVESAAPDRVKAVALSYLGLIEDKRGNLDAAVDYLKRALNYDRENHVIYQRMALILRHKKDFQGAVDYASRAHSMDMKDPDPLILLGNIYFETGNYDAAIKMYQEALKMVPENARVLYNMAGALYKKGDDFTAAEYYKRAAGIDRIGEVALKSYVRLGVIYIAQGVYDRAEDFLKQALAIRPGDAAAHYNLGIAYLRQNKNEEALQELTQAEAAGGTDTAMLERLGDAYFSINNFDRSLGVYQRILALSERNVRILSRIGEIYYKMGDLERAYDAYSKITRMEPATENARAAYLNMGNILDDEKRYSEAVEAYQKALAISPKDDSAYFNLGVAYKHSGKAEEAVKSWRKAASLNPNNSSPFLAIADMYYESGIYDQAELAYSDVIARWPNLAEPHFKMGSIYNKRNQPEYALNAFKRVVQLDGKSDLARRAYINIALISTRTKHDEDTLEWAQNNVQKALLIAPGDAQGLLALGTIYARRDMHDKAIDTFYQAIKGTDDPKVIAESYNSIGKSYYSKKEYKKSLQAFSRGVEEDPENPELRINRKTASQAYEAELARER